MDQATAGILGAMIVGGAAVLSNYIIGSHNRGKTEGVISEAIKGLSTRLDSHEQSNREAFAAMDKEQDQQWSTINRHTAEISFLQGKANGKAHV